MDVTCPFLPTPTARCLLLALHSEPAPTVPFVGLANVSNAFAAKRHGIGNFELETFALYPLPKERKTMHSLGSRVSVAGQSQQTILNSRLLEWFYCYRGFFLQGRQCNMQISYMALTAYRAVAVVQSTVDLLPLPLMDALSMVLHVHFSTLLRAVWGQCF